MLRAESTTCSWESPPSWEQVKAAGSRAQSWLLTLSERAERDIPFSRLLQVLVGCWICEKGLKTGTRQRECLTVARAVEERLDQASSRQQVSSVLLGCDATVVLLSAGILRALGRDHESLTVFVNQVGAGIRESRDEDQVTATELFALRFLLNRLNLYSVDFYLAPHAGTSTSISVDTDLFHLDGTTIRSISAGIAATTAFGQRPLSTEPEVMKKFAAVVPVWMIACLREYNIELGATLLRTIEYLRLRDDRSISAGLRYLLAQQQPSGYFGFLGPGMRRLLSTRSELNGEMDVYLPLTISCLWAIAETAGHDFVLFESI